MDRYWSYNVEIKTDNFSRADAIIKYHDSQGEFDNYCLTYKIKESDGMYTVGYRIAPYIYEDLCTIIGKLRDAGVQVTKVS